MRKICVFIGGRANYGRLLSLLKAIDNHPKLELQIIAGASAYSLHMDYTPDYRIQSLLYADDTESMVLSMGLLQLKVTDALKQLSPDIVLVHGDRYEVLAVAVAAAYMNIPLAHTEGGEITGTIDNKVRYAISALADIHFPVTVTASTRLTGDNIYVVGSTAIDTVLEADLTKPEGEPYILILHHPNTTHPESIDTLIEAVNMVPYRKIWVNPNVDAGSRAMLKQIHRQPVEFVKDLPPAKFYQILNNCLCAVGNSSSFIKEGAYLGVPCIIVGDRQFLREHANNVKYVDYIAILIYNDIMKQIRHGRYSQSDMFGIGDAAKRIVEVLNEVAL